VPVILVIEHKARQSPHEIVSTLLTRERTRRFLLSRFSWAALPRAGNASLSELDNDEGNRNWLLVAAPPTREIRKPDRRRAYIGVLDFFARDDVIRPPGLAVSAILISALLKRGDRPFAYFGCDYLRRFVFLDATASSVRISVDL